MNKAMARRKRWPGRILPILLVAWGLVSGCRADGPPDATAALPYAVEGVAEGLEAPWALAVAPDGRIFVTERLTTGGSTLGRTGVCTSPRGMRCIPSSPRT